MVDPQGRNLVFVLSTPRSGSTLLGALLGSHSQTLCPPEPWLLLCLNAVRSRDVMIVSHYDHELAREALHDLVDDELFHKATNAFLIEIYNSLLKKNKKSIFIDKTPRYYHVLNLLDTLFPLSFKVWIKRNPLDAIASHKATWGHSINELLGDNLSPHSFDTTISYSLLSSYFEDNDPKKISICYEDLVQDPGIHLRSLCEFIDLPFEEGMLNYGAHRTLMQMYADGIMGDKKIFEHDRPHTLSVGRWRDLLTPQEIQKIMRTFGSHMFVRLGYGHLIDEAAALAGINAAGIEADGKLDRLLAQYPSYVDRGLLTLGSVQHTLIARYNTHLLNSLENSKAQHEAHQEEIEALRQRVQEQDQALGQMQQALGAVEADRASYLEMIQDLSSAKGAAKVFVARCLNLVGLYRVGKRCEAKLINVYNAMFRHRIETSQILSRAKEAAKVFVARCLSLVGLYRVGKRCEAKLINIYNAMFRNRLNNYMITSKLDFIISHCEVNEQHGVGILLKNIFSDGKHILSIRSTNLYGGRQYFGDSNLCIVHQGFSRPKIVKNIQRTLGRKAPNRILSIPYFTHDVLSTIAIKDLFDVPLCTYIMDDQNICLNNIPDDYMKELLQKSDLRFGISRELCDAYEKKYDLKFWFLPPVVQGGLIQPQAELPSGKNLVSKKGILVGNIWSQQWLDRLQSVIKDSGFEIDWYGNPNREWLSFQEYNLQQDGISFKGYLPQEQLTKCLREAPYAVMPTGSTEEAEDRPELAKLSLPSRLPYIMATANTPIIVIGRKDSAAAKFVEHYQIGVVCDYDTQSFRQAVEHICSPDVQQNMRQRAAQLAQCFSADQLAAWIWQSLGKGEPCNLRFERLDKALGDVDVVITLNEVNQRHGTGALVKRIFADSSNIFSIRSNNHFTGDHKFGDISICLSQKGLSQSEIVRNISDALNGITVKRAFCVPYHPDELLSSIAIKEFFKVPLGTYIMDDQNICVKNISDDLMREFLSKCSLRLATHPEMRDAYEEKYGCRFWLLPAVVPDHLLQLSPQLPDDKLCQSKAGALIGSLWSKKWFDMLCKTIIDSETRLDWYGNTQYYWQKDSHEKILDKGITPHGVLQEDQLACRLKDYPYVVVPVGTLDNKDDRPELSRLSLPGRIIFTMATSNTPIILLGSEETSAGRFVKRFKIGIICDYNPQSFRQAVDHITRSDIQREMRQRAAAIAKEFSAAGITEWVWRSLELGEPYDLKFEKLMSR